MELYQIKTLAHCKEIILIVKSSNMKNIMGSYSYAEGSKSGIQKELKRKKAHTHTQNFNQ